MNLYPSGTIVFFAALLIYVSAFIFYGRGKTTPALLLLLMGSLLLKLFCSADMYLHDWDERYHALVAKNLSRHWLLPTLYDNPVLPYNPADWTSNHTWLHKQPVPLWLMAVSIKILGNTEWAVRLPSVIASTAGVILLYDIGCYFFNKRTAFISAFLFSISGLLTDLSAGRIATDHIDALFLFFTLLATWCMVKYLQAKKFYFIITAGLALGCALLTKWLPALICLPVMLLPMRYTHHMAWRMIFSRLFVVVVIAAAVAAPWHVYIRLAFPLEAAIEYSHMSRHITEYLDGHRHHILYHFDMLRIMYGELVYLPLIWFTYRTVKNRHAKYLAVAIWFWGVYLFFTIVATKMRAYTVIAAPAIFMITACFYTMLREAGKEKRYRFALHALAFLLLALPARYTVERVSFFFPREREPQWAREIKDWDYPGGAIIFNCKHPVEAMFYKDCIAYEYTPANNVIDSLQQQGYPVFVLK